MAVGAKIKEEKQEALERIEEKALVEELERKGPRLLSIEEEKILSRAINRRNKDSLRARNCFILCNRGLVVDMAKRYFALLSDRSVIGFNDLVQQGNLGLIAALRKFDPQIGKFGTYAFWWVKQAILGEIIYRNWPLHVPPRAAEAFHFQYKRITGASGKTGNLTAEELAEDFGLDKEIIQKAKQARRIRRVQSLNVQVGEDKDEELGNFIENPNSPEPFGETAVTEKRRALRELLSALSALDREVLSMRYAIDRPQKLLKETAAALYEKGLRGKVLSRERIRQIEKRAIKRLKQKARAKRFISSLDG